MNRRTLPGMPPVRLLSDLGPVDHPQFMPSSPHRLPPQGERPSVRVSQGLLAGGPLVAPSAPLADLPPDVGRAVTYEPHRYAQITEGTIGVGAVDSGTPFITISSNRRNFLGFRNTSTTETAYVSFGRLSGPGSWLAIPPGDVALFTDVVPQDDVYASGTGALTLAYAYSTFVIPS